MGIKVGDYVERTGEKVLKYGYCLQIGEGGIVDKVVRPGEAFPESITIACQKWISLKERPELGFMMAKRFKKIDPLSIDKIPSSEKDWF